MADWTPELTESQASRLAEAGAGATRSSSSTPCTTRPGWATPGSTACSVPTRFHHYRRELINSVTSTNPLTQMLEAAADGPPRRYVITGGPSSGKDDLIERIHAAGIACMTEEPGREIYRKHRERLRPAPAPRGPARVLP